MSIGELSLVLLVNGRHVPVNVAAARLERFEVHAERLAARLEITPFEQITHGELLAHVSDVRLTLDALRGEIAALVNRNSGARNGRARVGRPATLEHGKAPPRGARGAGGASKSRDLGKTSAKRARNAGVPEEGVAPPREQRADKHGRLASSKKGAKPK